MLLFVTLAHAGILGGAPGLSRDASEGGGSSYMKSQMVGKDGRRAPADSSVRSQKMTMTNGAKISPRLLHSCRGIRHRLHLNASSCAWRC